MADLGALGEQGLLTKSSPDVGQGGPWVNNGAEQGLITKRTGLYLNFAWDNNDAEQGLLSKRSDLYIDLPWDNNGAEQGLLTKRSFFENVEPPDTEPPDFPQAEVVNPLACTEALRSCLPCNDDPVLNTSAEIADVDRFMGIVEDEPDMPLGGDPTPLFTSISCRGICFSTISQAEADQCAREAAQTCIWDDPQVPGGGGGGVGGVRSQAQTCSVACPDGGSFSWTVPAGAIIGPTQAYADALAHSLACKLARVNQLCLTVNTDTFFCKDSFASFVVRAVGPLTQFPNKSEWSVSGPGIDVNLFTYHTEVGAIFGTTSIEIFGTPTVAIDTYIIVRITDRNTGLFMERTIPITVTECAVEWGNQTPVINAADVSYWNSGADIPAGDYRIAYINGAWISPGPIWLVGDGVLAGPKGRGYYIVYNNGASEVAFPTSGLYASQAQAEAGTAGLGINITHTGGTIGIYLHDSPYTDNSDGSPNPTFRLYSV